MLPVSWSLDVIDVASPCNVPWDQMHGTEAVRHCGQCKLHVYNISDMTRADAEAVIREHEGRLCVRFYRRHDGTLITRDCPTVRQTGVIVVSAGIFGMKCVP